MCQPVADNAGRRHLRSAARGDLAVPATRTLRYGPRSFALAGEDRPPGTLFQHRYAAVIWYPRSVVMWKLNCLPGRITSTLVTVSERANITFRFIIIIVVTVEHTAPRYLTHFYVPVSEVAGGLRQMAISRVRRSTFVSIVRECAFYEF